MAKKASYKYYLERLEYRMFVLIKYLVQLLSGKSKNKSVVFVAGVQRSGTNMMMDVVERSFETDVYHERDSRAFDNYQMKPVEDIRRLYRGSRAPFFVIKTLCELQDLTKLMQEFAPAKAVWVLRDYNDVVNSMLVSFDHQAEQVRRIAKYRVSDGWLSRGMSDDTYDKVKSLVTENIDDTSAAALSWYFRNILFFEQGFDKDNRVLLVKYEDLVTDAETHFSQLFSFLGLKYSKRISSKVFSSSIRRREAPVINPEIARLCDSLSARFDQAIKEQA